MKIKRELLLVKYFPLKWSHIQVNYTCIPEKCTTADLGCYNLFLLTLQTVHTFQLFSCDSHNWLSSNLHRFAISWLITQNMNTVCDYVISLTNPVYTGLWKIMVFLNGTNYLNQWKQFVNKYNQATISLSRWLLNFFLLASHEQRPKLSI